MTEDTLYDIAVIGLGVMGRNLALNLNDRGYKVVAGDAFPDVVVSARAELEPTVTVVDTPIDVLAHLKAPRTMLVMIKAGDPVDALIETFRPHLQAGDILIDGGNSHYHDTERRQALLEADGIRFVGLGVSGGEEGARHGPALMAGGDADAVAAVSAPLAAIAAKAGDGAPCFGTFGPGGAGHFVKMAHNGIEYLMMQALAECYLLLSGPAGLEREAMAETLRRWDETGASSYLLEITAVVVDEIDPDTGRPLVEMIKDSAHHKGTGRWTVEAGLQYGVAVPGIATAFLARALSSRRAPHAASLRRLPPAGDAALLSEDLGKALPAVMLAAYAQGLSLIAEASTVNGWGTELATVARTWRAGCIIRAAMLDPIADAFTADPELTDLTLSPLAEEILETAERPLRRVVAAAVADGVPVPALANAIAYLDGLRAKRVGANLIQGQRDLFGAHTFERTDKPGVFHHEWPVVS
ncbi:6-phosphogluconate dehydrogenase [Rhodobium orientis]|uniref:6-phosphogluconate dehydrogenase, decarboxylating n=1 Tax=Rhodobium orientis TaxID=34017 RepID=A0A327JJQ4_9HYPH|nr:NADP-dependent phosphogluconate dehydrogenase [Rhodobium orientis]MBB4304747.1 6-phosphogluconate dehydrogenase [Rhodobium orientis]MBK5952049.1 hypothetical protein [Rhodobium orientis]RAI26549.1 hypothetical protein CH339_13870 [Rhodobium orientis]